MTDPLPTVWQADAAARCLALAPRERDVLVLSCKGLTSRQVGDHLGVTHHTVEWYKTAIYHKLDVGSMVEAAVLATKAGLV